MSCIEKIEMNRVMPEVCRIVVPGFGTDVVENIVEHARNFCAFVVDDLVGRFVPKDGNRDSPGIFRVAASVDLRVGKII